jgi:hypothetical protein
LTPHTFLIINKVNTIISNAYELHQTVPPIALGSVGGINPSENNLMEHAIREYILHGEKFEPFGGVLRIWWKICFTNFMSEEGIWLNSRLLIMQTAQIILAIVATIVGFLLTKSLGIIVEGMHELLIAEGVPESIIRYVPTKDVVVWSLYPAGMVAVVIMIILILIYIPRYVIQF